MTPPAIELVRVRGTHREVGHQLGEAGRQQIRRTVETSWNELPSGRSKADQLTLAAEYRAFTAPRLPWLIEELDACAAGAGVDPLEFFAVSMEEIWYEPYGPRTDGRCSDIVAGRRRRATATSWWPTTTICVRTPKTTSPRSRSA
jgi:hypothetical protein